MSGHRSGAAYEVGLRDLVLLDLDYELVTSLTAKCSPSDPVSAWTQFNGEFTIVNGHRFRRPAKQ
jgi:hypothetical protein